MYKCCVRWIRNTQTNRVKFQLHGFKCWFDLRLFGRTVNWEIHDTLFIPVYDVLYVCRVRFFFHWLVHWLAGFWLVLVWIYEYLVNNIVCTPIYRTPYSQQPTQTCRFGFKIIMMMTSDGDDYYCAWNVACYYG